VFILNKKNESLLEFLSKSKKIEITQEDFINVHQKNSEEIEANLNLDKIKKKIYIKLKEPLHMKIKSLSNLEFCIIGMILEGDESNKSIMSTLFFKTKSSIGTYPVRVYKETIPRIEHNLLIEKTTIRSLGFDLKDEDFYINDKTPMWLKTNNNIQYNFEQFIACLVCDFVKIYEEI